MVKWKCWAQLSEVTDSLVNTGVRNPQMQRELSPVGSRSDVVGLATAGYGIQF